MNYAEIYVKRIKYFCDKKGLSVNELANMSGVKQSTLDNIMQGNTQNTGIANIHKIANAFNMTLSEFLDFEELNNFSFDD